jgi:hypothetical protein
MTVQVTFDCAEPHQLAAWWAELLGWSVEPQNATFIRQMVDQGFATEDETTIFNGNLVWKTGAAINGPDGLGTPRILFQTVPEPKSTKNRVHLDLRTSDNIEEQRDRAVALGATPIGSGQQGPHSWVVYTDPESNEFCL